MRLQCIFFLMVNRFRWFCFDVFTLYVHFFLLHCFLFSCCFHSNRKCNKMRDFNSFWAHLIAKSIYFHCVFNRPILPSSSLVFFLKSLLLRELGMVYENSRTRIRFCSKKAPVIVQSLDKSQNNFNNFFHSASLIKPIN